MITPESENKLLPTIDVIVHKKLNEVIAAHVTFTDEEEPLSLQKWLELLQNDPHQADRKAAVERLHAAIPLRGSYRVGDPRDIQNVVSLEPSSPIEDLVAYFVEASIVTINRLFEALARNRKSLEMEEKDPAPEKYWLDEAQRRIDQDLRLIQESLVIYKKYQWLYQHINDTSIEKEFRLALQESNATPRSALK
jgi:hypothetical protein